MATSYTRINLMKAFILTAWHTAVADPERGESLDRPSLETNLSKRNDTSYLTVKFPRLYLKHNLLAEYIFKSLLDI